jgi:hypothetical protein
MSKPEEIDLLSLKTAALTLETLGLIDKLENVKK